VYIRGEKLRRVSDDVLSEANPPADRTRPLEWRRSFNSVSFRVRALRPVTQYLVTEREWSFETEKQVDHWAELKPTARIVYTVEGVVDEEKQRDKIHCLVKTDEEGLFTAERPRQRMRVVLRSGDPTKGHKKVPDGVFGGSLVRVDFEDGKDYLCLEANVPTAQLLELYAALKANPMLELDLSALVLSFSYEVEDALREWYHPRTLLVSESTAAPIGSIIVPPRSDEDEEKPQDDEETKEAEEPETSHAPQPASASSSEQLLAAMARDIAVLSGTAKRMSLALWSALIVLVLVIVF